MDMDAQNNPALLDAPFRLVDFMERDIVAERRSDGVIILRSRTKLKPFERSVSDFLTMWAEKTPDAVWLAQRRGPERKWQTLTYGQAKKTVDAVTQYLLDLALPPERPIIILSGNSLEHAILTFAGMQARIAVAPISPAYSLMSGDFVKLRAIFDLIDPGLVFVQDGPPFERALKAVDLNGRRVVHVARPPTCVASDDWALLAATKPTDAVASSIERITPDTIGKLLFTSGSTGTPKAVINTQAMMTANVAMAQMSRPRKDSDPIPVIVDWLPWNHTMGGNASLHVTLSDGGTLYIDEGRPIPGMFAETLRNLKEISPTYYANVPAGFAMLAPALEQDDELAENFFRNLAIMGYGGATLPSDIYDRMQRLAVRHTQHRLLFVTGWGATETAPTATATYWATERAGLIGLPYPGVELKMVPVDDKYELRLRAVTITPGYYRQPELTAKAFDEEGFYKIGDAGQFVDPADPAQGVIFAGRVVEDFKLLSGTFVHVGALRVAALAAVSPLVHDALVAGQDKAFVGLLCWPNIAACQKLLGRPAKAEEIAGDPVILAHLKDGLRALNAKGGGSSASVARALMLVEPPSIDGNELTDKGYINQRAGLARRQADVDRLYAETPDAGVVVAV